MAVQLQRRLFTVEEYHKMFDARILDEDDRVELIDGEIVQMAPIRMQHLMCVNRLVRLLGREQITNAAILSPQNSLILDDGTELQPDIALLKLREYKDEELAPHAADALLVVEVADTTVERDRKVKAPRYAASFIPEYWLVDLPGSAVEVYSSPVSGVYQNVRRARRGDSLPVPGFPGVSLSVEEVLG